MPKINLSPINNLQNESTVTATINNNNTLVTAAVENSISRDGTQPNQMNSRLDMNSNQIINLPDAATDQEPVTYGQFIDGITSVDNGVVVDGSFIMVEHGDTTINDRVLTGGSNIDVIDGGPKGNMEVRISDAELNALATVNSDVDKLPYFTGVGTADVTDLTPFSRTLLDDADASTMRDTLGVNVGGDVQPHDTDLDALAGLSTTGLVARTGSGTATTRTVTGTSNEITVVNGSGVSGNPTVSLPTSLTFTGKTVSGGSFNSPAITTPTGIVKGDVGLGNVDNTSDVNKPISTATQTALDDKVTGPASVVAARVAIFNGTTGKLIQDGGRVLPAGSIVGTSDTQTLTSKTISGSSNTLSNIGNASLSTAADSTIKSNISGSSASPSDNTITAVLDKQLGTTRGTIAYRGASAWSALTPGTSGNFLKTSGTGADPSWAAIPGGGDLLSTNNLSDVSNATTALINLGAREVLKANRTYYVRTDGSDSNDGLSNTSGGAFLTIQKAIDVTASLDCTIYDVTIQVGAGTYTQPLTLKYVLGAGTYTVQGDTTTPANVTISTTSASCFSISGHPTPWNIKGFKMQTTTSGQCVQATNSATLIVNGNVEFGTCAGYHIFCSTATINVIANYRITGGAPCHINCVNSGVITFGGGSTTTGVGTLAFSQFCFVNRGSGVIHYGGTFSGGTYTGTRYLGTSVAYIDTNGGGANYFPGNAAGSVSSGAQYV